VKLAHYVFSFSPDARPQCSVYRDGKEMKVAASELVPGDLVRLYIGDRVPADMRIIESTDLKVG